VKYIYFKKYMTFIQLAILLLLGNNIQAAGVGSTDAIIIIGSSYANGTTRLDDNHLGSLFGLAVASGGYLSLGDALVREKTLNGLVINEANVGSTTFGRYSCSLYECLPYGQLHGYQDQFDSALKRTAIYDPSIPGGVAGFNAKYLIIDIANDCLHSDAFGIPQVYTEHCTIDDMYHSAHAIIDIALHAESLGMTVIIPLLPQYESLDLELVKLQLGLSWIVNKPHYDSISENYAENLKTALVNAKIVDLWGKFQHRGDGIHPNRKTVTNAARRIAEMINKFEAAAP